MSETILEIKDLNIQYDMEIYQNDSIRDIFVGMVSRPLQTLFGHRDVIHIIKNFNLTLKRGERLGIIGVNGVGKTSLCRAIAGMLPPLSGKVSVDGETRAIFETSVGIQPELTGRENALLLSRFIFPEAKENELKEITQEALEFSELGDFVDMAFKKYSKGMQSRLCLSLVTAMPTDLLILDEVFDGADHFFQQKVSQRTLKMIEQSGAAILVTHSPDQVEKACNRAIVLGNQKILFDGDVQTAIEYYHSHGENRDSE